MYYICTINKNKTLTLFFMKDIIKFNTKFILSTLNHLIKLHNAGIYTDSVCLKLNLLGLPEIEHLQFLDELMINVDKKIVQTIPSYSDVCTNSSEIWIKNTNIHIKLWT